MADDETTKTMKETPVVCFDNDEVERCMRTNELNFTLHPQMESLSIRWLSGTAEVEVDAVLRSLSSNPHLRDIDLYIGELDFDLPVVNHYQTNCWSDGITDQQMETLTNYLRSNDFITALELFCKHSL